MTDSRVASGSEVALLEGCARLAWSAVRREYPSHVSHLLRSDADARAPRELTPSFYGSFDWHSAVHGHWCLVRWLRLGNPDTAAEPSAAEVRAHLERHLSRERLSAEAAYLEPPERAGFERPYGLAWLLQLCAELSEWREDEGARRWLTALSPVEELAASRISAWLPRLTHPIRSGEHSQTAFAMGLVLDWTRVRGRADIQALILERSRSWYGSDTSAPIAWEPSGHDFLSPALAEADLMRRVLGPPEFARWWSGFLAADEATLARWLKPVVAADREDGKLAHFDGLNLSRAWMLEGIAAALPPGARLPLETAAAANKAAGLASLSAAHYAGAHWLGSFAVYLLTRRGISVVD